MITCVNKQCANYKQALVEGLTECPACGGKIEIIKSKVNTKLGIVACVVAVIGLIVAWRIFNEAGTIAGFVIAAASIVLGLISRSKLVVVLALIGVVVQIVWVWMWIMH